ncbi:3-deoxy-7-phosphoheptulonate synthase [Anaeromyxobacter diazotrophicus]|uniref:3-deoxy-D-arabino-heptulosonate 7-phosphate synthase n=1 Tax=Anaeromyxobacter diazotrophicus TaxID=2590199 RepID=A0A7I9VIZ7_9BACT|nr:3-deoxy-7-phosphoheptulonate synthase [Anaeromyxobacter diazotrophicus]GEJ55997.1 phospho-2-dehydro-3-deoxyheptonate aldolase [Anaeromyxobacter diazotrophicus]
MPTPARPPLKPPQACSSLEEVRASIDAVDRDIVALLASRRSYALQAARFKDAADGVKDTRREEQVVENVRALAAEYGIEPDLVETLYRDMIAGFVRVEQDVGGHRAAPVVENVHVESFDVMLPPEEMKHRVPLTERAANVVVEGRRAVEAILDHRDPRLLVVVGPCSIHDPEAGLDYARRLRALADEVSDTLLLVMRVYFEKPRTTVGWEGFTNDPRMNGSFRIKEGMERARKFLVDVSELGMPAATEALDPIAPHYRGDLIAWTAIGARTSESQTHRNLASGLSSPVGFKNGTEGEIEGAVNAIVAAARPHAFLGINDQGRSAVIRTRGNRYGHLVLRGGGGRPNFDTVSVSMAEQALAKAGVPKNIVIDCSHANSWKKPELQPLVVRDAVHQIREGNRSIVGLMIEGFIEPGNQPASPDPAKLKYGQSVTDPCLGWDDTAAVLREARLALRDVLPRRIG